MIILPILTTSLIVHFSFKDWENVLFELGSESIKHEVQDISYSPDHPHGDEQVFYLFHSLVSGKQ